MKDIKCEIPELAGELSAELKRREEGYKEFSDQLNRITKEITELLISKNKAYGNTALNPVNIFSKLDATEALCARLDDKVMRIKNKGITDETEDTVSDLIGYLLLLKMSIENKGGIYPPFFCSPFCLL